MDPGEDFVTAVIRETREETGLEVEIIGLAGATVFEMPAARVVALCLEVQILSGEICLSEEHDNFAWVPLAEFGAKKLHQTLQPLMLEYAQLKGSPS